MTSVHLWASWFRDERSWRNWRVYLACLFGLPLNRYDTELFRHCTAREKPLPGGYCESWLICGRRAGKSFILALIACFLSVFRDWRSHLTAGELGTIRIIATDRAQAKVIFRYAKALLTQVPSIEELIVRITDEQIELNNGIVIEIQTASFRSVRGHTVVAALLDECAFWRSDETSANPDEEVLAAVRPAMSTVPGSMLLCASSPYSRRGILWKAYKSHWGAESGSVLVWKAPTRVMNQTGPQSLVDTALAEDPAKASSEFLAEFRSDLGTFVDRDVVEAAVVRGRHELAPVSGLTYSAFCDPSGSAADSMTLGIAHREDDVVILDLIRERRPKFSPEAVVAEFTGTLAGYGIGEVTGDHYGGEWIAEKFRQYGVQYKTSERVKNVIYAEFLAPLNSNRVRLLDNARLIGELCSLERRTTRGNGKDVIDHPPGMHDDLANAAAGALVEALMSAVGSTVISAEALTRARQATSYGRSHRYERSSPPGGIYGLPFSVSLTDMSGH